MNNIFEISQFLAYQAIGWGLGIGTCVSLSCWVPAANKLKGYFWKLAIFGMVLVILGTVPFFVFFTKNSVTLTLLAIESVFTLILALIGYFVPTIIAFKEMRSYKRLVLLSNCLFFIPFNYFLALVVACVQPELIEKVLERGKATLPPKEIEQ